MDHNPKAYFLFSPNGHYSNAMAIYSALKRNLDAKYFGTNRKSKKHIDMGPDFEPEKVSFKGTPFQGCSIPYEVFHMNRRTKLTVKQSLSRLGFLMLRDGSLLVKDSHDKKPELVDAEKLVSTMVSEFQMESAFSKPDYFVPVPVIEGMSSAQSMAKTGVMIHCLDSRLVYPQYGVYTSTSQEYLNLLSNYMQQQKNHYSRQFNNMVDLGCGTGILPIVMSESGGYPGSVFAFDS